MENNKNYKNIKLADMMNDFVIYVLKFYNIGKLKSWEVELNILNVGSFVDFTQEKLEQFLSMQFDNDFALNDYVVKEAKYALIAWVDEIFINSKWLGQDIWKAQPLESKLFFSYSAGETIFKKIDQIVEKHDSSRSDLLYIYLTILGLGFEGKFRTSYISKGQKTQNTPIPDNAKQKKLANKSLQKKPLNDQLLFYTNIIYRSIYGHDNRIEQQNTNIFEQPYNYTLGNHEIQKLILHKPWYILIASIFGLLLLFSQTLWFLKTHEIEAIAKQIFLESKTK